MGRAMAVGCSRMRSMMVVQMFAPLERCQIGLSLPGGSSRRVTSKHNAELPAVDTQTAPPGLHERSVSVEALFDCPGIWV